MTWTILIIVFIVGGLLGTIGCIFELDSLTATGAIILFLGCMPGIMITSFNEESKKITADLTRQGFNVIDASSFSGDATIKVNGKIYKCEVDHQNASPGYYYIQDKGSCVVERRHTGLKPGDLDE